MGTNTAVADTYSEKSLFPKSAVRISPLSSLVLLLSPPGTFFGVHTLIWVFLPPVAVSMAGPLVKV